MISSMTGFARRVEVTNLGELSWILRSLNHRSLDISIQLPERYRPLEADCRRQIAGKFNRGRIDASLTISSIGATADDLKLDESVLQSLLAQSEEVQRRRPDAQPLTVAEILRWPGIVITEDDPSQKWSESVIQSLDAALDELNNDRLREGHSVAQLLLERLDQLKTGSAEARRLIPEAQEKFQERMSEKLADLKIEVDPIRMEQEVGLMLVKLDVAEEIDRIDLHISEFERVLKEESLVGKRLGFLLQELGREFNTLGSKTLHYPLNSLAVDMKVTLEQMREQVQNVE